MGEIRKVVLDNGVRVLVEPIHHVRSVAIGLWCKTGSRHEHSGEEGITHFIEHMLFKGTSRRNAMQIAEAIEGRGGMLNAFTDKEQTCYYCRVLAGDVESAVDVLADMMTGSLLDPEEIEREKTVVLEEIKRGEDEPGDHVHDLHMQARWGSHPLGKPVIGTRETVSSFQRADIVKYIDRQYRGENVVLAAAGYVEPEDVVRMAREWLGGIQPGASDEPPPRPRGSAGVLDVHKPIEQVHFCIGTDSSSVYDADLHTSVVLDGILGGGMSSRLFQEIREKRGLAYSIGSYGLTYSSGGALTVYGGTAKEYWPQVRELVRIEFDRLIREGPSDDEVERVKRNVSGNLVLALEGMSARMMRMTKNELNHEREVPIEETLAKIEAVTVDQVAELAGRILTEDKVSTTTIGPA
jgi:predicted Zn-dependent peptidase